GGCGCGRRRSCCRHLYGAGPAGVQRAPVRVFTGVERASGLVFLVSFHSCVGVAPSGGTAAGEITVRRPFWWRRRWWRRQRIQRRYVFLAGYRRRAFFPRWGG
ncbi:unnamed protein product, partial [Laminaria digitata]